MRRLQGQEEAQQAVRAGGGRGVGAARARVRGVARAVRVGSDVVCDGTAGCRNLSALTTSQILSPRVQRLRHMIA